MENLGRQRKTCHFDPAGGGTACSDREVMIAYPYLRAGYHAFVQLFCKGTAPGPTLNDYEQAMELIQQGGGMEHHRQQNCRDQLLCGGHLAACAATLSRIVPMRPFWVITALGRMLPRLASPERTFRRLLLMWTARRLLASSSLPGTIWWFPSITR